jgi:ketosteroid isomerase-like protein
MKKVTDKDVVVRFVRAINDHDVNEIVNLMPDDHVFIDGMDQKSVGKKAMKEGWDGYFELFPDYRIEIYDIIENESGVGLFGYASATYKNLTNKVNSNFWRIPAAWKSIVENNKIKHWQVYCDYSNLFKIIEKNK